MSNELIEGELTYKIIGVLYKVHNKLGNTHQEKHYQKAINNEFISQRINFKREFPVNIEYEFNKIGEYKIDFIVEDKLVLEIKHTFKIEKKFLDQILRYMNQLQIKVGLIANFKTDKVQIKRLILPDKYLT